ncbi:hypothetical protein [Bordetella sp. LUAb4]|uniref:hypothetical protein n=1 Tax=Bordetella sp. LUAb4 TaxID=2843195 RepID=UPI001E5A1F8D|nr:hypothetical protein [Bordetella sp. LUAb4]
MKMQRLRQLTLGSALSLLLSAAAWADREYVIYFAVDKIPNDWTVTVNTPLGYAPNSECMSVWQVPAQLEIIGINHDKGVAQPTQRLRYFVVKIKDKDDLGCWLKPKYNTWTFEIKPPFDDRDRDKKKVTGQVQFHHSHNHDLDMWMTAIYAKNTDDKHNFNYVGSAICDSGIGYWQDCLNRRVYGSNAANTIYIYFQYQPI